MKSHRFVPRSRMSSGEIFLKFVLCSRIDVKVEICYFVTLIPLNVRELVERSIKYV